MFAIDLPNPSLVSKSGPFDVKSLILISCFTEPSDVGSSLRYILSDSEITVSLFSNAISDSDRNSESEMVVALLAETLSARLIDSDNGISTVFEILSVRVMDSDNEVVTVLATETLSASITNSNIGIVVSLISDTLSVKDMDSEIA
jgi:predicted DNA-binding protein (UPF0278 family)